MPTSAPVTSGRVNELRKQYGTGLFGQLMMNLALAPPVGAPLIDLTGGPETWLRAIKEPIEPDPESRLFHGIGRFPNELIEKTGLTKGWFGQDLTNKYHGPNFLASKFKDLPQPVLLAKRLGIYPEDPELEYVPAWAGKEIVEKELERIREYPINKLTGTRYMSQPESFIKDVQHQVASPSGISIPLNKLSFINARAKANIPLDRPGIFQELMKKLRGYAGNLTPEEIRSMEYLLK